MLMEPTQQGASQALETAVRRAHCSLTAQGIQNPDTDLERFQTGPFHRAGATPIGLLIPFEVCSLLPDSPTTTLMTLTSVKTRKPVKTLSILTNLTTPATPTAGWLLTYTIQPATEHQVMRLYVWHRDSGPWSIATLASGWIWKEGVACVASFSASGTCSSARLSTKPWYFPSIIGPFQVSPPPPSFPVSLSPGAS